MLSTGWYRTWRASRTTTKVCRFCTPCIVNSWYGTRLVIHTDIRFTGSTCFTSWWTTRWPGSTCPVSRTSGWRWRSNRHSIGVWAPRRPPLTFPARFRRGIMECRTFCATISMLSTRIVTLMVSCRFVKLLKVHRCVPRSDVQEDEIRDGCAKQKWQSRMGTRPLPNSLQAWQGLWVGHRVVDILWFNCGRIGMTKRLVLVSVSIFYIFQLFGWHRKAQGCGLQMIPIPHDPLALPYSNKSDPLRGPIFIPLDIKCLQSRETLFKEFGLDSSIERLFLFQEAIVQRFGFISCTVEPPNNAATSSTEHQYIHSTGTVFVLVSTVSPKSRNRINSATKSRGSGRYSVHADVVPSPHEAYITRHVSGKNKDDYDNSRKVPL